MEGLDDVWCQQGEPQDPADVRRIDFLSSGELRSGAVAPALQSLFHQWARASALTSVLSMRGRGGAKVVPSAAMASLRPPRLRLTNGICTVRTCVGNVMRSAGRCVCWKDCCLTLWSDVNL